MKLAALTSRERRFALLLGVLVLFIAWLYTAYIVGPLARQAAEFGRQVRSAREQVRTLETATAHVDALREQVHQVTETVTSLKAALPSEEELPEVIALLSDLARQARVKIETVFPRRPEGAPESARSKSKKAAAPAPSYKDMLIEIDAAAGYHAIGTFLSLVESGPKPIHVSSLRIAADPRDPEHHRIKLLLRSYFGAGPAGPGSGASSGRQL